MRMQVQVQMTAPNCIEFASNREVYRFHVAGVFGGPVKKYLVVSALSGCRRTALGFGPELEVVRGRIAPECPG
jgi:hypothetical protein